MVGRNENIPVPGWWGGNDAHWCQGQEGLLGMRGFGGYVEVGFSRRGRLDIWGVLGHMGLPLLQFFSNTSATTPSNVAT